MKRFAVTFICLWLCIALCGCKPDNAPQDVKPAPEFMPLTEIVDGRQDIYLIVKVLENSSYWQVIMDGARDCGDALDCNVYYSGSYVETDWQSHERLLHEAKTAGADAILIAPDDSVNLSGKIDEIYNGGIPIVLIDTIANTDNYNVCYMTDNLMAGQEAAREMIAQLKADGYADADAVKVGIQVGSTSSLTIIERLAGFFQYWSKYAPPSWEILQDIKCNEGDTAKAVTCAEELLANPEIKSVFGANNGSTVGFAQVVKQNERRDVAIVGFDYSGEIAELIADEGYSASTILQKQYDMGYKGVETALSLINGEETSVKFVDTGVIIVNRDTLENDDVKDALSHN